MTQNQDKVWERCHEVLVALRQIIRSLDLHSRYLLRQHGITGPQLVMLQEIAASGEMTVSHLARATSLSQGTVTNILARLEKNGLVTRTRSAEDRRRVFVGITAECERLLQSAPSPLQETFVNRFQALENWEQDMILSSVKRLAGIMEGDVPQPRSRERWPEVAQDNS